MIISTVYVPYTLEQDEDGVWCARADLGPFGAAFGDGETHEEAIAELREAVLLVADDEPELQAYLSQPHVLTLEVA